MVAAVRPGSQSRLADWLAAQGVHTSHLDICSCEITQPDLGLEPTSTSLDSMRDVYNAAARMAFGLTVEEARRVNVSGALNVLEWAAGLSSLRRESRR